MLLRRKIDIAPAKPVRVFRYGAQQWLDPNPDLTPEQVRDLLAEEVPELTTAAIRKETTEGAKEIWTLEKSTGKRGTVAAAPRETYVMERSQGSRG
jgi:PRTRC genetic system protein C